MTNGNSINPDTENNTNLPPGNEPGQTSGGEGEDVLNKGVGSQQKKTPPPNFQPEGGSQESFPQEPYPIQAQSRNAFDNSPPQGGGTGQSTPSPNSPLDVLEPQAQPDELSIQPTQGFKEAGGQGGVGLTPRKKSPKIVILLIITVLLLGGLIILALGVRSDRIGPLIGTSGEITWWGVTLEEAVAQAFIDEFREANPNIKINYVRQSTENYRERLTNALASGNGPDIFEIHNSWIPMFRLDLAPLPPQIMSSGEFTQTFYPVIVSNLTTQAGIVAIPLEYDALTLFINEDIFASAARTPPRTWDELRQLARELTQKNREGFILQSGASLGMTENIDHWQEIFALMMIQNGASLARPEGARAEDALRFFVEFKTADGVWDETLPPSTVAFSRDRVAMYFAPTSKAQEIFLANPSLRFRAVPLPQLPKNDPSDPDVSYATYWVQAVWQKSKNSDLAWELLKYLSSSESLERQNETRKEIGLLQRVYPRRDMALLQREDRILGSVVVLADDAKSWYLADQTYDGPTGINSQLSMVFEQAVNEVSGRGGASAAITNLQPKVAEILSRYGIPVR